MQGRGSAANSAVCYALGITAVDPVGMDLLFERFLSEERGEWPDIDLDLPSGDQRERAIQYVYQRYGKLGAAMTANVITYRGRSAAREVGKALGFEVTTLERLSSLVRTWEWKDPKDTTERQFREAGFDLRHPRIRKFFELYRRAGSAAPSRPALRRHGDLPGPARFRRAAGARHHARPRGGAVGQGRLRRHGHHQSGPAGPRHDGGASRIRIKLIHDVYGEEVDLAHLPPDDPAVYRSAAEGRHRRHVPGGKPRADGVPAAHDAARSFTTSWCRWRSSGPARSSARWCIRI